LQDKEFRDLVLVHDILNNKSIQNTSEAIFHAVRQAIMKSGESDKRVASKRTQIAIRDKNSYHYDNDFLFRKVFDSMQEAFTYKLVIPSGGLRSFWYNGRKQRLSLRKSLLLLYHDSEMAGGHSNRTDTLEKIRSRCWWPSMATDVASWVGACTVCRLTKPQKGLTTEQAKL
jgi:hypothetical protein